VSGPILAAPWAIAAGDRFRGSQTVELTAIDPEAAIFWTTDQNRDPREGQIYTDPITLTRTTTLRFIALKGHQQSAVMTARFDAMPHGWQLELFSAPNPQYTAGGADALIDGRRGPDNWRTGFWHGYEGQDFVAVLDLGQPVAVHSAGAGFLQDMRSWIFMPRELIVEISVDGLTFVEAGRIGHDVPDREEGVFKEDLILELDGKPIRALRFHAVNYGPMPEWHLGAGGEGFIFVDELIVN